MLSVLGLAWALDAEGELRHHLDQAREFYKRKYYADAALELEEALRTELGQTSFEVWWLAAQVDYARMDVAAALGHSAGAISVAPSAEQREKALAFRDFLNTSFGFLRLQGPREGSSSRVELVSTSLIFDPELKAMAEEEARLLEQPVSLPHTIPLPVGSWTVGEKAVEVLAGQTVDVQLGERQLRVVGRPRVQVALGAGMGLGERLETHLPSPGLGVGVQVPVGPLLLGVQGAWQVDGYLSPLGETVGDLRAGGVGVQVGTDRLRRGAFWFLPTLSFRHTWVPGLPLSCDAEGACLPGAVGGQNQVRALGTAWAPGLDLAAEYRPSGRTPGVGLRGHGEWLFGQLPEAGTAQSEDGPYSWTLADRSWMAAATDLSLYLSFPL